MLRISRLVLAALCAVATLARAQCPAQGLSLAYTGGRLGDPFSLTFAGSPSVPGLLAIDTVGGPTVTNLGTVCLGVTPAMSTIPFTLNASGHLAISGIVPPTPALDGSSPFLQAGAIDPSQPSGTALSNGINPKLRAPHMAVIDTGPISSYGWPLPGSLCTYDVLTNTPTSGAIPLPGYVQQAVAVPDLDLVAILSGTHTLTLHDLKTGALVLTKTLTSLPTYPTRLAVTGTTLYALCPGVSPSALNPGGSSGIIYSYSLPSGTIGPTTILPAGYESDLLVLPGTTIAYLPINSMTATSVSAIVAVVDLATGASLPPINLGGSCGQLQEWRLHAGILYCLMQGVTPSVFWPTLSLPPGLNAIDTATNTAFYSNPVPLPAFGTCSLLRYGPGSGPTPSLFAYGCPTSTCSAPALFEISPLNLGVIQAVPVPSQLVDLEISPGATEWLLMSIGDQGPSVPALHRMTPPALVPTLVAALPAVNHLEISPVVSATLRKAYVTYPNFVVPLQTDPLLSPGAVVPVPIPGSNGTRLVID